MRAQPMARRAPGEDVRRGHRDGAARGGGSTSACSAGSASSSPGTRGRAAARPAVRRPRPAPASRGARRRAGSRLERAVARVVEAGEPDGDAFDPLAVLGEERQRRLPGRSPRQDADRGAPRQQVREHGMRARGGLRREGVAGRAQEDRGRRRQRREAATSTGVGRATPRRAAGPPRTGSRRSEAAARGQVDHVVGAEARLELEGERRGGRGRGGLHGVRSGPCGEVELAAATRSLTSDCPRRRGRPAAARCAAVRGAQRIVRHHQHGDAELLVRAAQQLHDRRARRRVEVAVGSSASRQARLADQGAAIATRCICPPESWPLVRAPIQHVTSSSARSARARIVRASGRRAAAATPRSPRGEVWQQVEDWNTRPTSRRRSSAASRSVSWERRARRGRSRRSTCAPGRRPGAAPCSARAARPISEQNWPRGW